MFMENQEIKEIKVRFHRLKELLKRVWGNTKVKKGVGVVLIIIGLVAFFTPLTPGSWLVFVGMGFLGVRILFWEKIVLWIKNKFRRERL